MGDFKGKARGMDIDEARLYRNPAEPVRAIPVPKSDKESYYLKNEPSFLRSEPSYLKNEPSFLRSEP